MLLILKTSPHIQAIHQIDANLAAYSKND